MRVVPTLRVVSVLVAALGLSWASPAAAQEVVSLTGRVVASDGTPQIGATVIVDQAGASALTDEQGRYALTLPPGTHTLRVSSVGYSDAERTVEVRAGASQVVDFELAVDPRLSETIVVVGARTPRTQLETTVPVDVITDDDIAEASYTETNQLLNTVAPSFNASHLSIVDGTDHIDPASLRGLGPEHVLVLVNGKRRQQSALVNFFNGGTVGVDLNAIPTSAISRIEVLRDGAASQYGSDAIAGVLNIVLKDDVDRVHAYALTGITASGDGQQLKTGVNGGMKLGEGFVNLTGEFLARARTNRAEPWPGDIFPEIDGQRCTEENPCGREMTDAELERRGLDRDDFNMGIGQSGALVGTGFLNAAYPLNPIFELYAHGGYTYRKGNASGYYRFPGDDSIVDHGANARVDAALYPNGFLPEINPTLNSWSGTAGTRAKLDEWKGDLSLTYGGDSFHFFVENSMNASLGEASPTEFDAGKLSFAQTTANLDLMRSIDTGFLESLALVAGSELRHENYSIVAGDRESYELGPETYPVSDDDDVDEDGVTVEEQPKAPGSQVFPGFQPRDESDETRLSVAAYAGAESKLTDRINLDIGGRFEHYNDFGSTVIGKVAGRVAVLKMEEHEVAVRGAASTGFRAPGLQQIWYSTIATNFVNDPVTNVLTANEILVAPNRSAVARAFGMPELEEETSVNLSAGLTARLFDRLSLSADYYRIAIKDRVVLSGLFSADDTVLGPAIGDLLADFDGVRGAQFYVNAVDTTTHGLDVVVDYTRPLAGGTIGGSASANFTRTEVDAVNVPASVEQNFGEENSDVVRNIFLSRDGRNRLEDLLPRRKGTLALRYAYRWLSTGARANYFGPWIYQTQFTDELDERFGSEVTFDADVGFQIGDLGLRIGGNNVFNNFPDEMEHEDNRFNGSFVYGPAAPYGIEGAFYYVRLDYVL